MHLLHSASLVAALLLASCANGPGRRARSRSEPSRSRSGRTWRPLGVTAVRGFERPGLRPSPAPTWRRATARSRSPRRRRSGARGWPTGWRRSAFRATASWSASESDGTCHAHLCRLRRQSPPCGNWDENIAVHRCTICRRTNFGCATQHNLAAEIADPRDLVTPQPMTPPDTERRMIVIDKWRQGEPTLAQKTQEQSGAVSDVAH